MHALFSMRDTYQYFVLLLNCWHLVPAVTAKIDISECLSLLFGKLKPCNFLSFIVLWLLQPTTKYDFAFVEGYQEGNAKFKISIKKKDGVVVIFGGP